MNVCPALVSPLLKEFGWDESCTQITVSNSLGLPPRLITLTDHLQDVTSFKRKPRLLTGRGLVLQWNVIKKRPHIHLKQYVYEVVFPKNV